MRYNNKKKTSGQTLPITAALVALIGVSVFMVLNSHRAVDEKMNLVNAADAAAFSGAQMAARELNFMALTNRAMIANEVAIGHMMAYQTELDVIADALKNGVGGLIGTIIDAFVGLIGGDATIDNVNLVNKVWSGAYILAVNATNALYQDYQEDDYRALAGLERDDLLFPVMNTVAQQYIVNPPGTPRVVIEVNTEGVIAGLEDEIAILEEAGKETEFLQQIVDGANSNPFCHYIVFAQPSNAVGVSPFAPNAGNRFNGLVNQCRNYFENGNAPNSIGSLDNPVPDAGALLELLNRSANNSTSADWVMRRNADYSLLFASVRRRGESAAVWDNGNGRNQINWKTDGADTIETRGVEALLRFAGSAEGDAKTLADEAATRIGGPVIALLEAAGLCDNIDCDSLGESSYTGVQRYAMLNPLIEDGAPVITAALIQRGNCNDSVGRDSNGELSDGWDANLPYTDQIDVCGAKNLYAYAQAKVIYQRPTCTPSVSNDCEVGYRADGIEGERPNLFNPFWQAKLSSPAAD